MNLQQTVNGDMFEGQTFSFAIDTCQNFQQYTNSDSCKDNDVVTAILEDFIVYSKLCQAFYSTKTYAEQDQKLSWTYHIKTQPLCSTILTHKSWNVTPQEVYFENWWLYSD